MLRSRRKKDAKAKGPKKVAYELIAPDTDAGRPMYALLRTLQDQREDLHEARIALAWCTSWKPDVDGRLILGKCVKATDLHREMAPYDFVILLLKRWWTDIFVPADHREAVLFHELCHAGVVLDQRSHEPVRDEKRRIAYRIVKHDIEEFTAVVDRYGFTYRKNLEEFATHIILRQNTEVAAQWQPCDACRDSPRFVAAVDDSGKAVVAHCPCWIAYQERRKAVAAA